jgi:hypothetical protein
MNSRMNDGPPSIEEYIRQNATKTSFNLMRIKVGDTELLCKREDGDQLLALLERMGIYHYTDPEPAIRRTVPTLLRADDLRPEALENFQAIYEGTWKPKPIE